MKPRKVPMRMCVGCREMKHKMELIRVVRTPDGEVKLDASSKMPGRGAYLCKNSSCLEKAVKTKALERALEHKLDEEVYKSLREGL